MDLDEWRQTTGRINDDIAGIIHAQRVLSEINAELQHRDVRPLEEDFIYGDALGRDPGDPRVFDVDGVQIRVRVLHRRGLRQADVKGADLLYEIAGRKFVLVQYKSAAGRGRVQRDSGQLAELIGACPNPCPPVAHGLWPTCGSWFNALQGSRAFYMPACVAAERFGDNQSCSIESFRSGLSPSVFQELFATCWVGARTSPTEFAYLSWSALERDRVLVSVLQQGAFGL